MRENATFVRFQPDLHRQYVGLFPVSSLAELDSPSEFRAETGRFPSLNIDMQSSSKSLCGIRYVSVLISVYPQWCLVFDIAATSGSRNHHSVLRPGFVCMLI